MNNKPVPAPAVTIQPRRSEETRTLIIKAFRPSEAECIKELRGDEISKKSVFAWGLVIGFFAFLGTEMHSFVKEGPGHSYVFSKIGEWFFQ